MTAHWLARYPVLSGLARYWVRRPVAGFSPASGVRSAVFFSLWMYVVCVFGRASAHTCF